MYKALLLTAGFGDGHNRVAEALATRFAERNVQTFIVDCYRSKNPAFAAFGEWVYEWTTRYTPGVYGASYNLTAGLGPDHGFWRLLSAVSKRSLLETVKEIQPDVILQLFPDHMLARMTRLSGRPLIGTVLTDFSIHGRWFHRNVDVYFIPDERLTSAISRFADSNRCIASGIPLRKQFMEVSGVELPARPPYVLIATGGRGVFPALTSSIERVRRLWPQHDVYVLCGRNEHMRTQVDKLGNRIRGLGFQENIAPWLYQADFAITKAGGVTMAECLAAQTPMLLYKPQPGQELGNARFAEREGAAFIAGNPSALEQALERMAQPHVLEQMQAACRSLAHANAAQTVVDACLDAVAQRDHTGNK